MNRTNRRIAALLAGALLAGGCDDGHAVTPESDRLAPAAEPAWAVGASEADAAVAAQAPVEAPREAVVDSSHPPAEQLRRFRATAGEPVARLAGGATTREELVRRFIRAVEHQDTAALRELVLTRVEFAYIYYADSPLGHGATRMDPAVAWFLIQQNSEKGITRVLRRFGGRPIDYRGHDCPSAVRMQSRIRIREQCTLRVGADSVTSSASWFGAILELDGRFKFVSYANDF